MKKKTKREMRNHFKWNENENTPSQNVLATTEAERRGKFITINA